MKKYFAMGVAGLMAISVAACGTTRTIVKTQTVAGPPTPTTTTDPTVGCVNGSGPTDCSAQTDSSTDPTATDPTTTAATDSTNSAPTPISVDRGQTLKLSSLDAKVLGVSIQNQLSSDMGVKTANGRYVVISVALTNRAHSPQNVPSDQTALASANGDNYTEAFDVENGIDQNSMLWKNGLSNAIQPGQTAVGDYVYEVPNGVKVSGGVWGIVNFGDSVGDNTVSQIGGVRLGNLS